MSINKAPCITCKYEQDCINERLSEHCQPLLDFALQYQNQLEIWGRARKKYRNKKLHSLDK